LVPVLCQLSPVGIFSTCFSKTSLSIDLPSTSSSQWSLSCRFSNEIFVYISFLNLYTPIIYLHVYFQIRLVFTNLLPCPPPRIGGFYPLDEPLFRPRRPGFKTGSGHVGFCDGQKWRWGRFSPRTSVSPANLHCIYFSTIIFTITRGWHSRPGVAAVPIAS
jgi:hypothetical protein